MKINKIYLTIFTLIVIALILKFTVLRKPDTRLLYTVQNNTFLETIEVSGTFNETATDTQIAASYAAYQNTINTLVATKQNKQVADAAMWIKRQAVLSAENGINYKNNNTTNPLTKEDYTELEKLVIDSTLVQAEKDFRASEVKYKEADVTIRAAQAQVNTAKIEYDDTRINEPFLVVHVNEVYLPKISVGQHVSVIFDAMKDTTLTGRVEQVDSVGTITSGVVTFEVKISIDNLPAGIKPNMTAVATIELINKENTLTVPHSAIVYKDGKAFVQKADSPNGVLTEVQIGQKGYVKVEVLSGINAGNIILARPEIQSL